jgi:hypothetical protein
MRIHTTGVRKSPTVHRSLRALLGGLALATGSAAIASEDIEFTSEHIGEVGLENRFATLPIWGIPNDGDRWSTLAQLGYTSAAADSLAVAGPMLSVALHRSLTVNRTSATVQRTATTCRLSSLVAR